MNTKQRIVQEYKYLQIVKKTIMGLGIIVALALAFTIYIKNVNMVLAVLGGIVTLGAVVFFVLLWLSIPKMKKHILELAEKC